MRDPARPNAPDRPPGRPRRSPLLLLVALAGCGGDAKVTFNSVADPPAVRLVRPEPRTIVRTVGQPSFVEAYERTSIYAKLTGYIEDWRVDIGDRVRKGDTLATLFVPELLEDHKTKGATVALEKERIALARKVVEVAQADVKAARAALAEAEAILGKFQAEVDRWDSEVNRLQREVDRGVVDPQVLLESTNQLKSSTASRGAAEASIHKARADLLSKQAAEAKAEVDVSVATAALAVAESDYKRIEAWVGYMTLSAPYDGVIVARNANTFDFVLPLAGDPTAMPRAPDLSPSNAAPIFVVDRLDVVRIFVDIPEADANYVKRGTKASVLARAYRDGEIPAEVTRTAWALNVKSRTLRAEIDLPNPDSKILPGMYAYGKVIIERPGVRALPLEAVVSTGGQAFCWSYVDGRATRLEIETGVRDGSFVEVTNRRPAPRKGDGTSPESPWTPFDGSEQIILGDLSILTEGETVRPNAAPEKPAVASAEPRRGM